MNFPGTPSPYPFFSGKYFGTGILFPGAVITTNKEFWKYEGGNFTQLQDLPFNLYQPAAFDLEDELYVMGGLNPFGNPSSLVFRYTVASQLWETVSVIPDFQLFSSSPSFSYNGNIYFVGPTGNLWKFDTVTLQWEYMSSYPEGQLISGSCVVSGDKAFIGLADNRRTLWEYDITNNSWKAKKSIPFGGTLESLGSWEYNGKIYYMLNTALNQRYGIDVWEFDPNEY